MARVEPNYFVCTLGQAAKVNAQNPHEFKTINEFLDEQSVAISNSPAVGFPLPKQSNKSLEEWDYKVLSFGDLHRASLIFARLLKGEVEENINDPFGDHSYTVALLCPSSPLFLFAWLGLMRLGLSVLLIAPQCQASAIAHLCKTCNASILFYDEIYKKLSTDSVNDAGDGSNLSRVLLPCTYSLEELFEFVQQERDEEIELEVVRRTTEKDVAYLHHTSGTSTGLPKPIAQTHRAAVGVLPSFSDGCRKATFTTTPLYHGGIADCFRSWTSGALIWLFPGKEVPITAENVSKCLDCAERATHHDKDPPVKYFSSVPYVLQMVASEPNGLERLKAMDIVGVGGAALPQAAGDDLVAKGVNLISRFGSAECGFLMSSHRDYSHDKEWQFLRSMAGSVSLRFERQEDGLFELVILPGWPHMAKHNREDGSFATADLFAPHSSIPMAWKYHSRADSQLTLITGKKFDPAPFEAAIATSPLLSDILIFGNGQQYPGALLFRSMASTDLSDTDLVAKIWPDINKLNDEGQDHTRIFRSMLLVMPADAPHLEKSSKGSVLRGQAEKMYQRQIEGAYQSTLSNEDSGGGADLAHISDDAVSSFVLQTIKKVTGKEQSIPEDADLFSQGVDSVACMQIRAALQMRVLPPKSKSLPLNIVYDCGTIRRLSQYLVNIRKGTETRSEDEFQLMSDLVHEYGTFNYAKTEDTPNGFDTLSDRYDARGEVVILTGATGALGAHVLDELRLNPNVSQIFCLIRASDFEAAYSRISKSLVFRKKEPLDASEHKIVCMIVKFGERDLGLSEEDHSALRRHTTVIIHVAWAVNFSMRLRSFVKDHIAGLRNLLDLAMRSERNVPPRFVFCSSTASVLGPKIRSPISECISHDPSTASPLGYSRSKWVAEAICEQAHLHTRMKGRVHVLRIGQLCGDTEHGIWNVTEAWPLMLSTVNATKSLPALEDEQLSWLPVNIAAKAVLQVALSEGQNEHGRIPMYHLINDNKKPAWMEMLGWMKTLQATPFEVVPPRQWVEQLENLTGEYESHPAKKLLGLWKDAYCNEGKDHNSKQRLSDVCFVMERTRNVAPVMDAIEPITFEHFEKMWRWIERELVQSRRSGRGTAEASVIAE
ncbi:hypothetical protein MMC13_007366 [Lambiella insularis]|nr:hypothetical protein [Lambiella insularis]